MIIRILYNTFILKKNYLFLMFYLFLYLNNLKSYFFKKFVYILLYKKIAYKLTNEIFIIYILKLLFVLLILCTPPNIKYFIKKKINLYTLNFDIIINFKFYFLLLQYFYLSSPEIHVE